MKSFTLYEILHTHNTPDPDKAGGTQALQESGSIRADTWGTSWYFLQHCSEPTSHKGPPKRYLFPGGFVQVLHHFKCSRLEFWRDEGTWIAPHPLKSEFGRLEGTAAALLRICENQVKPGGKNPANARAEAGYWNCGRLEEGRCTRLSRLTQQRVRSIPWLFLVCLQCRAGLQAGPQSTPSPSAPAGRSPSPGKVWRSGRFGTFAGSPSCLFGAVT